MRGLGRGNDISNTSVTWLDGTAAERTHRPMCSHGSHSINVIDGLLSVGRLGIRITPSQQVLNCQEAHVPDREHITENMSG